MPTKISPREILALAFFSLLAIFVFAGKAVSPDLHHSTATILDAIVFFLALAIGWIIQGILSRADYQRGLKDYALSAYRRVTDISDSVARMKSEAHQEILQHPESVPPVLHVIDALADELGNTVRSAIVDWADVIGDDIDTLHRLDQAQRMQLRALHNLEPPSDSSTASETLRRLEQEIETLRGNLPTSLRTAIDLEGDMLPREGRLSPLVLRSLRATIRDTSSVRLMVRSFSPLTSHVVSAITRGAPYSLHIDVAAGSEFLIIKAEDGEELGVVANPFDDLGVYDKDYHATLLSVLPVLWNAGMGGMSSNHIIQYSAFDGPAPQEDHFFIKISIPEERRSDLLEYDPSPPDAPG